MHVMQQQQTSLAKCSVTMIFTSSFVLLLVVLQSWCTGGFAPVVHKVCSGSSCSVGVSLKVYVFPYTQTCAHLQTTRTNKNNTARRQ
jgi:hypothetical protein